MSHSNTKNFTNIENELKVESKELFGQILGYENIKEELKLIRSWYLDKNIEKNEKVTLPKGILFYGEPGCGKTLFSSEMAKSFNWPIVVIKGDDQHDIIKNIHTKFEEAKKYKKAILIIDEIDLLIGNSSSVTRALQTEIDGFENKENEAQILIIATTNEIYDVPGPLKRPGRFDKHIEVKVPDEEDRVLIFNKFFEYFNMDTSKIDWSEIGRYIKGVSGADIKAICNDLFLRNVEVSTDELVWSFERVVCDKLSKNKAPKKDYSIAIHEAGHILMSLRYPEYTFFHDAEFVQNGAKTYCCNNDKIPTFDDSIKNINISLSGMAAEKVVFGNYNGIGCTNDIVGARNVIFEIIERCAYRSLKDFTFEHNCDKRVLEISEKALLNKEKQVTKILLKEYKKSVRYIKKHKEDLLKIAKFLFENGKITYKDIPNLQLSISQNKKINKLELNKLVLNSSEIARPEFNSNTENETSKKHTVPIYVEDELDDFDF